ncbi:MAG: DUF2066 domain-containing protein [Pseudomonadota bacterium]
MRETSCATERRGTDWDGAYPFSQRASSIGRAWLAWVMMFAPLLGSASTVDDLYGVSIDLIAGERAASQATAQRALAAVLVKVTGLAEVTGSALVAPVLAQAEQLVQQQGFSSRRTLRYVFDEAATREAVLAAGLPYWDDDRPHVLVLLKLPPDALESDLQAPGPGAPVRGAGIAWRVRYLTSEDEGEVPASLFGAADRRGLPLLLPTQAALADTPLDAAPADDAPRFDRPGATAVLPTADDATHPAQVLAGGLGADVILMGEGDRTTNGIWQVRWQLFADAQSQPWIGGLESGPEYLADVLASRYAAYAAIGVRQVALELNGVANATAYERTLAYLRRLDLVQRVDLRQARAGRLMLSLTTRYEPAKLERLLQLSDFLVPTNDGRGVLPDTLRFDYQSAPVTMTPGLSLPAQGLTGDGAGSR